MICLFDWRRWLWFHVVYRYKWTIKQNFKTKRGKRTVILYISSNEFGFRWPEDNPVNGEKTFPKLLHFGQRMLCTGGGRFSGRWTRLSLLHSFRLYAPWFPLCPFVFQRNLWQNLCSLFFFLFGWDFHALKEYYLLLITYSMLLVKHAGTFLALVVPLLICGIHFSWAPNIAV